MSVKSKTIIFTGAYEVELAEIEVPQPKENEILVKTLYTGVSTGTETRVLSGKQSGSEFPLIPGYENVGEIVEAGKNCKKKPGDIVFNMGSQYTAQYCRSWGAQQEYSILNENEAFITPKGVEPKESIYGHVAAIAYRGITRVKVNSKDTVAIVGLGLIGHLAAQSAKSYGAKVIGIDRDPARLKLAKEAGVDFVVDAANEDVKTKVDEYSNGGVTVAVDVTGIAATIPGTANLVHPMPWSPPYPESPRILILGSYTDPIVLEYDPLFFNEVDIHFSRDMRADDLIKVLDLIAEKKINPNILNAKTYSAEDAVQAYKDLVDQKLMRILFKW